MIEMPRRSVTRFFIPLVDVFTLLFCIFLIMPLVKPSDEGPEPSIPESDKIKIPADPLQLARDYQELEKLRKEHDQWQDWNRLRQEKIQLEKDLPRLRQEKIDILQNRMTIRVLEIGEEGRLFYYDPGREKDRRVEITQDNYREFIAAQQRATEGKDLFFLLMYPRPAVGISAYPLLSQRQKYDRWFEGVAHGYDIR